MADEHPSEMVQALVKFSSRVENSCNLGESAWHRLAIKVESGNIKLIQMIVDEQHAVDDKMRKH